MSSFEEPHGFGQWLGAHCRTRQREVPRAGTVRRRMLARVFAILMLEGLDAEDFRRASQEVPQASPEATLAWLWGDHATEFGDVPVSEADGS